MSPWYNKTFNIALQRTSLLRTLHVKLLDQGVQQLIGDEGLYLPNGKLLCLWNAKTIETVHEGH